MEDKIILTADDGTEVTFYVIEETRLGASNYLMVEIGRASCRERV